MHTIVEDWINSPLGEFVDGDINGLFQTPSNVCGVICDGVPGTLTDPTGGTGGLLLGDGGAGYDAANGGNGGAGGEIMGNGGAGGDGGTGGTSGVGQATSGASG